MREAEQVLADARHREARRVDQYSANNTAALPGTGWRVPSFNELMSLVDYYYALPAIEPTAFPNVPTALETVPFFTSSVAPGDAPFGDQAGPWLVDFMLGDGYAASPGGMAYVRCVR